MDMETQIVRLVMSMNEEKIKLFDASGETSDYLDGLKAELKFLMRSDEEADVPTAGVMVVRSSTTGKETFKRPLEVKLYKINSLERVFVDFEGSPPDTLGFAVKDLRGFSDEDNVRKVAEIESFRSLPWPWRVMIRGWKKSPSLFQVVILGPKDDLYEGSLFLFNVMIRGQDKPPLMILCNCIHGVGGDTLTPGSGGLLKDDFVSKHWSSERHLASVLKGLISDADFFIPSITVDNLAFYQRVVIAQAPAIFKDLVKDHYSSQAPYLHNKILALRNSGGPEPVDKTVLSLEFLHRAILGLQGRVPEEDDEGKNTWWPLFG